MSCARFPIEFEAGGLMARVAFIGRIASVVAPALVGAQWVLAAASSNYWIVENSGAPWSLEGNLETATDVRFEVRSGDRAPWDIEHHHAAERSEMSVRRKQPMDQDIWLAFGLMVEPGAKATGRWSTLGQLHPTTDPGDISPSPAWEQELAAGDVFQILVRSKAQKPLTSSPVPKVVFADAAFKRGQVYHFVYRIRYSLADGLLQARRDGRQIVNYSGPIGYDEHVGPYFKFGIYREPAPETLAVHFNNLKIGDARLVP